MIPLESSGRIRYFARKESPLFSSLKSEERKSFCATLELTVFHTHEKRPMEGKEKNKRREKAEEAIFLEEEEEKKEARPPLVKTFSLQGPLCNSLSLSPLFFPTLTRHLLPISPFKRGFPPFLPRGQWRVSKVQFSSGNPSYEPAKNTSFWSLPGSC